MELLTEFFQSVMQFLISLGCKPQYVAAAMNKLLNDGVMPCDLWYILDLEGPLGSGYFAKFTLAPSILEKLQKPRAPQSANSNRSVQ